MRVVEWWRGAPSGGQYGTIGVTGEPALVPGTPSGLLRSVARLILVPSSANPRRRILSGLVRGGAALPARQAAQANQHIV
ncbi:hypothetical protein O181_005116 [Austropuccinia psidii MF-1]|uniref:Uncharacterized protein n=1 Tax=Austropuccinia psidii MF-1 TaxID=1389203 RepID=A0A9Q3GFM1_9BASI|nr:hypothetical protein [Austropuccinia psidii MF-1]